MRASKHFALVLAAFLTAIPLYAPDAAVRTCGERLQSEVVTASSELEGKKLALAQWRAQAAKLGSGYDGWHVAVEKALKCFPKGAQFECMAVATPCVIQQNPNQRPSGPDRKGEPL
jgi:hypothetical protein